MLIFCVFVGIYVISVIMGMKKNQRLRIKTITDCSLFLVTKNHLNVFQLLTIQRPTNLTELPSLVTVPLKLPDY